MQNLYNREMKGGLKAAKIYGHLYIVYIFVSSIMIPIKRISVEILKSSLSRVGELTSETCTVFPSLGRTATHCPRWLLSTPRVVSDSHARHCPNIQRIIVQIVGFFE